MIQKTTLTIIFLLLVLQVDAQNNHCWSIDYETWNNNGMPSLYIDCGNDEAFNLAAEATLEVWIRAYTFAENRKILGKIEYADPIDNGYVLGFENLHVYAEFFNPTIQQVPRPGDGPMPPDSSFVHMVSTYSSNTGTIRNYVNGMLTGETTMFPADPIVDNDRPFIIGNAPWDLLSFQFYGDLDEVRVWNVARTQEDIQQTMHYQLNGDEDGLVACYNFNDASGAIVPDQSINEFDGTLSNYEHESTSFALSGAPVADAAMSQMVDVNAVWYRNTENYHKLITENGIIVIAAIPEKDFSKYLVAGHNGNTGVTNSDAPETNPAGFLRTAREWYMNAGGNISGGLTISLEDANIESGFPLDDPVEQYALLYRASQSEPWVSIQRPTSPYNAILQFNDHHFQNGYYALGYSIETFEIQQPNSVVPFDFEQLLIAPNPVYGQMLVKGYGQNTHLTLYNLMGQTVLSEKLQDKQTVFYLNHLKQGIYIVEVKHKQKTYTTKIVKQ